MIEEARGKWVYGDRFVGGGNCRGDEKGGREGMVVFSVD